MLEELRIYAMALLWAQKEKQRVFLKLPRDVIFTPFNPDLKYLPLFIMKPLKNLARILNFLTVKHRIHSILKFLWANK